MSNLRRERLYYDESDLFQFTATVVECLKEEGDIFIRLDKTAFYPTSGGQPNDTGYLNAVRVRDVFVRNEYVYHVADERISVGEQVTGCIDIPRRQDHMVQHAGQHIVSACFEQLLDIETVGFHLGDEYVTIDLDANQIDESHIWRVEQKANQVVLEDRKITSSFVSDDDLARLNLRHQPKVKNNVRIVIIEGFDNNPCGGTHPSSTGKVGQIKFLKIERVRNQTRLSFVCGNRALREHAKTYSVVRELNQMLSTTTVELVDAVKKMSVQIQNNKKVMNDTLVRLARLEAQQLLSTLKTNTGNLAYCSIVQDADNPNYLKMVLQVIHEYIDLSTFAIALIAPIGNRIYIQSICTGDVHSANKWILDTISEYGGKGGGNGTMAQGSIPIPSAMQDKGLVLSEKVKQALENQFTLLT